MNNFKRLILYLKPYRVRVGFSIALMFAVTLTQIPFPLFQAKVVDVAIPHRDVHLLVWIFAGVMALYAVRGVVSYTLNYLIGWLGQRVIFDMRFQSYRHLQRLSLAYYDGRQPGKIMARLDGRHRHDSIRPIAGVRHADYRCCDPPDRDRLAIPSGQPRLALLAITTLPLYVLNYKLFLSRIRIVSVELRERWEKMISTLTERIGAIAVVKAFSREAYETDIFHGDGRWKLPAWGCSRRSSTAFLGATSQFIRMLGTGALLWYGGNLGLWDVTSSQGELFAFLLCILPTSTTPPFVWSISMSSWQWANAAIERVFETLDTSPEIVDATRRRIPAHRAWRGRISQRDLRLRPQPARPP